MYMYCAHVHVHLAGSKVLGQVLIPLPDQQGASIGSSPDLFDDKTHPHMHVCANWIAHHFLHACPLLLNLGNGPCPHSMKAKVLYKLLMEDVTHTPVCNGIVLAHNQDVGEVYTVYDFDY